MTTNRTAPDGRVFTHAATATKLAGQGTSHAMTDSKTPACGSNLNRPGVWVSKVSDAPSEATCKRCQKVLATCKDDRPDTSALSKFLAPLLP